MLTCLLGLCLYIAGMIAVAQPYATSPRTCPAPVPGEVEGESYSCGVLSVPENYAKPDGRTLEISYAVLTSTSLSPAPDPVVYLEGGPGGSSLAGLDGYAAMFASLRATRNVILFDQRGAEHSGRLAYNPALLAVQYYADSDPELAQLLENIAGLEAEAELTPGQEGIIYGVCAALLRGTHDLDQYNSRTNAKDVSNLVQALGYKTYNLYGISYGTRLALNVLRTAPKGVRSVVLDSSYPPQLYSYERDPAVYDEVFVNLFRLCAEDSGCNASYPNLPTQFETLLERLSKKPVALEPPAPVAGVVAAHYGADDGGETDSVDLSDVGMLAELLNDQGNLVARLYPQIISQLAREDTGAYRAFLAGDSVDESQENPDALLPVEQLTLQAQALQQDITDLQVAQVTETLKARPGIQWVISLIGVINKFKADKGQNARFDLLEVMYKKHNRAELAKYVKAALVTDLGDPDDADVLLGKLQTLSDDDVREAFEFLNTAVDQQLEDTSHLENGMFYAVECSEEAPFNDADNVAAVVAKMRFPLLAQARGEDTVSNMKTLCLLWNEAQSPASVKEPVVSDVPTLILSGLFDVKTPSSWNALAQEGLSRSRLLEFPGAGHGVIMFSQCAKDVAAAFVANPLQTLDSVCVATLKPQFALPEAKQAVK